MSFKFATEATKTFMVIFSTFHDNFRKFKIFFHREKKNVPKYQRFKYSFIWISESVFVKCDIIMKYNIINKFLPKCINMDLNLISNLI